MLQARWISCQHCLALLFLLISPTLYCSSVLQQVAKLAEQQLFEAFLSSVQIDCGEDDHACTSRLRCFFMRVFFFFFSIASRPCSSIVTIHPLMEGDNESKLNSAALLHAGAKTLTHALTFRRSVYGGSASCGRRAHVASKRLVVNSN